MNANARPGWYVACVVILCFGILAGCSAQSPSPSTAPSASPALPTPSPAPSIPTTTALATAPPSAAGAPRLDVGGCPFTLPAGYQQGKTVDCGFVTVPERHGKPDGPTIHLAVARFHSLSSTPDPVPMIYLSGGPGATNRGAVTNFSYAFPGVIGAQDVIVFDQRGVGKSQPALDCPELRDQTFENYTRPMSLTDGADLTITAGLRCRDRLVQQGIDLTAYTGREDAADVNDIRLALGYDKVDLLGISYGTRLALTVMRDFPQIVSSVVLDSVVPLQEDLYGQQPLAFDRALNLLFDNCAAEGLCAANYPTLRQDFAAVVRQMNAQPVTVAINDPTGAGHDVVITGDRFVVALFDWLYSPETMQYVPAAIEQLKGGTHTLLAQLMRGTLAKPFSYSRGMEYSVMCSDVVRFERYDDEVASARGVMPEIRAVVPNSRSFFGICDQWPKGPADPREQQAVTSDTPTLVLESANDPATPPAYGQDAARTLSRSIYVEVPGIGHSVVANGGACVQTILTAYFADPTHQPLTACTAGLGVIFVRTP